jgi:Ni/Co efflux regulator RcnB
MKLVQNTSLFMAVVVGLVGLNVAVADEHDDHDRHDHDTHAYVRHNDWKKGYHLRHEDWDRGAHIDYREHRLKAPPRGYEWREVDGNFVLAAVATGVIASVIAAEAR